MASNPKGRALKGSKFPISTSGDKIGSNSSKRLQAQTKQETGQKDKEKGKSVKQGPSGASISTSWRGVGSFQSYASPARNHQAFGSTGTLHRPLTSSSSTSSLTSLPSDSQPSKLNKSSTPIGKSKSVTQLKQNALSLTPRSPLDARNQQNKMSASPGLGSRTPGMTRSLQDVRDTPNKRPSKIPVFQGQRYGSSSSLNVSPHDDYKGTGNSETKSSSPGTNSESKKVGETLSKPSSARAKLRLEVELELLNVKHSVMLKAAKMRRLVETQKMAFSDEFLQTDLCDYLKMVGNPSSMNELINGNASDTILATALQKRTTPERKRVGKSVKRKETPGSVGGARSTDSGIASFGKASTASYGKGKATKKSANGTVKK